jgi:RNA-directed DNA polymerase
VIAQAKNTPLDKVRVLQRKLYLAAKTNPKRKFGALYDKVCREDVLRAAYAQVKANKGAPGIDQQSFEDIEKEVGVDRFLSEIRQELIAKRYKPLPVLRCSSRRRTERKDRWASLSSPIVWFRQR